MLVQNVTIGDPVGAGFGKISAGELSAKSAAELADQIKEYVVAVDSDAPSCCIDGRKCISCMDGQNTEPRPSVAGGALITAYAAAELTGWFSEDASPSSERLGRINRLLGAGQIKPGNHCDQTAVNAKFADGKTGCGADDRFSEIIVQPFDQAETIKAITSTIMGGEYDERFMQFISKGAVESNTVEWTPTNVIDALGAASGNNIEILESDDTPTHGHRELAVVFNFIDNTTVDRDSFVDATGEQVFVVDMWYIDKLAKVLATGPYASEQYSRLKHAMAAYQAATYITLCDGSQRPIILQ